MFSIPYWLSQWGNKTIIWQPQLNMIIDFFLLLEKAICVFVEPCGCCLSIIFPREAVQSPCSVYIIRLIVPMSDRRSAAADITQTQQSRHHCRENKNASLILKRKRLGSKREGSIFFLFAWGRFSFCMVSEYRVHCLISVPLQLSCPNSNLLWFMWLRSCFQPSHLTMKRVYVSHC